MRSCLAAAFAVAALVLGNTGGQQQHVQQPFALLGHPNQPQPPLVYLRQPAPNGVNSYGPQQFYQPASPSTQQHYAGSPHYGPYGSSQAGFGGSYHPSSGVHFTGPQPFIRTGPAVGYLPPGPLQGSSQVSSAPVFFVRPASGQVVPISAPSSGFSGSPLAYQDGFTQSSPQQPVVPGPAAPPATLQQQVAAGVFQPPPDDRQSNWFYGLHLPTPSELLVQPLVSLLDAPLQLLAPLGNNQQQLSNNTNNGTISNATAVISSLERLLEDLFPGLLAPRPPSSQQQQVTQKVANDEPSAAATFRSSAQRARASLSISGADRVGEAFFYQASSTDDVTAIIVLAGASAAAKDIIVSSATPPPTCGAGTVYNPSNVPNGGIIASGLTGASVAVINRKLSNTVISLFAPNSIIGRTLLVRVAGAGDSCGEIVAA